MDDREGEKIFGDSEKKSFPCEGKQLRIRIKRDEENEKKITMNACCSIVKFFVVLMNLVFWVSRRRRLRA